VARRHRQGGSFGTRLGHAFDPQAGPRLRKPRRSGASFRGDDRNRTGGRAWASAAGGKAVNTCFSLRHALVPDSLGHPAAAGAQIAPNPALFRRIFPALRRLDLPATPGVLGPYTPTSLLLAMQKVVGSGFPLRAFGARIVSG
jgi:hypothetical protein